ncbi:potassium channel family protein [Rubrobacter calidifluminis]|uniref:potassium channel family protein n=1 Tax=Rubrobacter calidifluminis TaxID=1392640 RepID=UPI00235DD3BA|nr:TrkA family potassium uptake protein [Rubrobacter calidifluminis]
MSKQFAVIGLGRVGASLARTLREMGHEVLAMDRNEDLVQELSAEMPGVELVSADASESGILAGFGLEDFDGAAVVIGEDIQASVLITLILKELGVPLVLARAGSPLHARVLEKVGADHVVEPEREFGELLAHRMSSPAIQEYLEIGGGQAVARVAVPGEWVGHSLSELGLPGRRGLLVLAIQQPDGSWRLPDPGEKLRSSDTLMLGGPRRELDRLEIPASREG